MPYRSDRAGLHIRPENDRRRKLTEDQKDEIRELYKLPDWSQRRLAGAYGVSRRLITFILDEEKLKRQKELFAERQKDGRYYDAAKHTEQMREHRHHKHGLFEKGLLEDTSED